MSRNKYQRRRGLRPSTTAASAVQTELIQGPVTHSQSSTDLGREAARQIKEQNNPNTRYIDKPDATSNKNLLRQAQGQQQAAMASVQRQVLGEGVGARLKPSGTHRAPSIPVQPRQLQLVAKGGGIHLGFAPTIGANLAAAGAGGQRGGAGLLLRRPSGFRDSAGVCRDHHVHADTNATFDRFWHSACLCRTDALMIIMIIVHTSTYADIRHGRAASRSSSLC